jgi:prevent-host-death family protein
MASTYSVSEAQSRLPGLIRKAEDGESIQIRRREETVAVLMSRARMEAIVETIEILANPEAMKAITAYGARKVKLVPLSALDD